MPGSRLQRELIGNTSMAIFTVWSYVWRIGLLLIALGAVVGITRMLHILLKPANRHHTGTHTAAAVAIRVPLDRDRDPRYDAELAKYAESEDPLERADPVGAMNYYQYLAFLRDIGLLKPEYERPPLLAVA